MIDIDNELQQHYAEQELDESVMEQLLAMEAEAPVAEPAPAEAPWWRSRTMGTLAAAALAGCVLTGGGLMVLGPALSNSFTSIGNKIQNPTSGGRYVGPSSYEMPAVADQADMPTNGLGDVDGRPFAKSQNQAVTGADAAYGGLRNGGRADETVTLGLVGQNARGPRQLAGGALAEDADNDGVGWADGRSRDQVNNVVYDLDSAVRPTGVSNSSNARALLDGGVSLNRMPARVPTGGDDGIADAKTADVGLEIPDENVAKLPAHGRYRGVPRLTPTNIDDRSTFSVDTDTAAWTRARTALTNGYFPNAAEVRPEEFINAFTYDYEAPRSGPFGVSTEIAPSPYGSGRHLVRIGVQGKRISVFERKPVHLTFLVDVSGSMQSADKLELAKSGLRKLVGELKDGDTVAIVTYAGRTAIELEPTPIARRGDILGALDRLTSSGGTAMGAGIDLAYQQAERSLERGAVNRVVLVSDGDANVGETNHDRLAAKLRRAADKGITLTTLGFGSGGYNDRTMETLADKGDGQYHYIANERDAERVLVDGLTGTLQTIARDVKLQVSFDASQVEGWRLIGYENRVMAHQDFRNDRVDAGEVGAGHQVTALYEVDLVDPHASMALGTLNLRYEAPGAEGAPAVERAMRLTGTPHESLGRASNDMRMAVVAGVFADALRGRPSITTDQMLGLLPSRPEYADRDDELRSAIRRAKNLGL